MNFLQVDLRALLKTVVESKAVRDALAKARELKGPGHSYGLLIPFENVEGATYGTGAGLMASVKKAGRSRGGNGGGSGTAVDVYGMKLDAIYQEFAGPQARAAHDALDSTSGGTPRHGIKEAVRVKAELAGLLKPLAGQVSYPAANSPPKGTVIDLRAGPQS